MQTEADASVTQRGRSSAAAMNRLVRLTPQLACVPFPGTGKTWARWRCMIAIAANDPSLGRLAEGHLDALAILHELGRADLIGADGATGPWGVWAAQPDLLRAERTSTGWHLAGAKAWCSGSIGLGAALVSATADDGPRLFSIQPGTDREISPRPDSWIPFGMASTASETLDFDVRIPDSAAVGGPGAYVDRPGFHHGGAGVAACWFGATTGVLAPFADGVGTDPHGLARWGRTRARMEAVGARLEMAAGEIDSSPTDRRVAERIARSVRLATEDACRLALDDAIVALGASGLARPEHHLRIADAMMYLRQLRPDGDAAAYGAMSGELLTW